ncbi:MAG: hypothetical protein RQ750_13905, partial [Roseovarius sp.]|nr:hypothetical protein [Roseovarius sp.]
TVTDQLAHFVVAFAIAALFLAGGIVGGFIAGASCGLIREVTEAGGSRIALSELPPHFAKLDPWIDVAFWALGGGVAAWTLN